jgi:UDP-N-acetyl-D-galactosamine dehydrogenase
MNYENLITNLVDKKAAVAVIGLGYVGRPLFLALVKAGLRVVGYDVSGRALEEAKKACPSVYHEGTIPDVFVTSNSNFLADCRVFLVTVPTPIHHDGTGHVDLECMISASRVIGKHAVGDSVVIYESTAYPGISKEMIGVVVCASEGRLAVERNLYYGYSPERITPGDTTHELHNTNKIVSGCDKETSKFVKWLYSQIVTEASLYETGVEIAEAAKVLENVQRDVNIALMNDLTKGFHKLGIDIREVVKAAATKWNFGVYGPGLVGGHCIAVDPWYLEHKFNSVGCSSELIRTARKVSDSIPQYIVNALLAKLHNDNRAAILQLGLTYKPDICDWRDSRAIELAERLTDTFGDVMVTDHHIVGAGLTGHRDFSRLKWYTHSDEPKLRHIDAIVLAVPHKEHLEGFVEMISKITAPIEIIDVCGVLDKQTIYRTGHNLWTL